MHFILFAFALMDSVFLPGMKYSVIHFTASYNFVNPVFSVTSLIRFYNTCGLTSVMVPHPFLSSLSLNLLWDPAFPLSQLQRVSVGTGKEVEHKYCQLMELMDVFHKDRNRGNISLFALDLSPGTEILKTF